jgi:hypothetical protein
LNRTFTLSSSVTSILGIIFFCISIVNTEREKKTKTDKVTKIQAITYTDIRFREQNLLSFSCFRKEAGIFSALYFNKCGSFDPIDNVQIYINFGVLTVTLLIEVHVKRLNK